MNDWICERQYTLAPCSDWGPQLRELLLNGASLEQACEQVGISATTVRRHRIVCASMAIAYPQPSERQKIGRSFTRRTPTQRVDALGRPLREGAGTTGNELASQRELHARGEHQFRESRHD